jgi:membrane protein required for colicin V production
MNWVDIAILAVILVSALIGLARGLIREVVSLGVWVAAFVVAYLYHQPVADALVAQISEPSLRLGVALVVVFLAVLILGAIVGALLTALVAKTGLTGLDRLFGLAFGAARGAVLVAMAVFLGGLTPLPAETWWQESRTIGQFKGAADWLLSLVPVEVQEQLKKV